MRLAFLGNAFEMGDCVSECLASLVEDLIPTNALTVLDDVPEELRGHEAMKGVTAKVIEFLADMLDKWTESDPPTVSEKDAKQNIVTAFGQSPRASEPVFWREHFPQILLQLLLHLSAPQTPHLGPLSENVGGAVGKRCLAGGDGE